MWNNTCTSRHEYESNAHSQDWPDECMRTWYWKCKIPSAKIPYNSGYKDWDNKNNTKTCRLTNNGRERKEMKNAHSNCNSSKEHSEKVEYRGNHNWFLWCKRVTIYNWCNSIGCIIHPIDKLECENNKKTNSENNKSEVHKVWLYMYINYFVTIW